MQASPYQSDILKAVQQRVQVKNKKGLIVEALAGCGKSTILWMIAQELQKYGFRSQEVVAVVFGKKNQLDLERKFKTKVGRGWGESVRTIHSLCYGIYRDALGVEHKRVRLERGKYKEIAQRLGLLPIDDGERCLPGSLLEDNLIFTEKDFTDLVEKLRLYCLDATADNVAFLTELYKLGIRNIPQVAAAAQTCLTQGLKEATGSHFRIDTTDMVWVPWVLRGDARFTGAIALVRDSLRVLMVDEVQDTDILQIEILSLLIDPEHSFLVGVGDRKQAVFFFRGCLNDGMDRITKGFNGESLPLPVCYRCGVLHLELVRELFCDIPIQPRPNAPQAEIRVIWEQDFLKIFDNQKLSYMGVCRKNAPLTVAAIRLLAAGKPAVIKDRNVGSRLVSRVREICQRQRYNPGTFPKALQEYEAIQKKRILGFPDGESKINDLEDILKAIWALFEAYAPQTLKAWEEVVNRIFKDSDYDSPISLYSIHSGKGGEGQVVFILAPDTIPLEHPKQVKEEREQEDNLLYVALTRCLADEVGGSGILYIVIREDDREGDEGLPKYPEWLPKRYRTLKATAKSKLPETRSSEPDSSWNMDDAEPSTDASDDSSGVALLELETEEEELPESPKEAATQAQETPSTTSASDAVSKTNWSEQLDEEERQQLKELEEQIIQSIVIPKRWWYQGGKALQWIRDKRLYRETHSDFHEYCLSKFSKTRRHIDRWIAATATLDNLEKNGCEILPTAESVLRPIANLPEEQQVAVWSEAVRQVGRCPVAAKVELVRREMFEEPMPQTVTQADPEDDVPPVIDSFADESTDNSIAESSQTKNWIRRLPLSEMESLYVWLGEVIEALKKEEF